MTDPLRGLRIAVCRARDQAISLVGALEALGADVVRFPVIEVAPPLDEGAALADAVSRRGSFDWVALTSANGARAWLRSLERVDPVSAEPRVAAVGGATARAVREAGLAVAFVPTEATAAVLAAELPIDTDGGEGRPMRVLAPLAELAGPDLMVGLADRGAEVEVVTAYRTVTPTHDDAQRKRLGACDAVVVTSPSVIDRLVAIVGLDGLPPRVVAIGPVSADAVRRHGVSVTDVADPHDERGLIDAVVRSIGR